MEKKVYASEFRRKSDDGLVCVPPEKSPVQQHFKDECDIHHILRRIEAGGDPSVLEARRGAYVDVIGLGGTLADALDIIERGETAFDLLPSEVRSRFDHDLGVFAAWIETASKEQVAEVFGESSVASEPRKDDATINDATMTSGEEQRSAD